MFYACNAAAALLQINAEQLERDAHVVSKVKVFRHGDHCLAGISVGPVILVLVQCRWKRFATTPVAQVLQNLDLDERLVMKPLLVPDELDRHVLAGFPVEALENNAKRALAQHGQDLVAEVDVVVRHNSVVPPFVVKTVVGARVAGGSNFLLGAADKVYMGKVQYFSLFEQRHLVHVELESSSGRERVGVAGGRSNGCNWCKGRRLRNSCALQEKVSLDWGFTAGMSRGPAAHQAPPSSSPRACSSWRERRGK
jgi:hypothetical protein